MLTITDKFRLFCCNKLMDSLVILSLSWCRPQLKDLSLLERCLKETLRLRPPIMTMMRMARTPQVRAPAAAAPPLKVFNVSKK